MRNILLSLAAATLLCSSSVSQTIGPDSFGYTLTRTNNPSAFINIAGNPATQTLGTGDDVSFPQALPFSFGAYGSTFSAVQVCTNGFLQLGPPPGSTTFTNGDLSTTLGGTLQTQPLLAPYWDDLISPPGSLLTLTRTLNGHQQQVFQWDGFAYFAITGATVTFQAILQDDGTIMYVYNSVSQPASGHENGGSATIGIRDAAGNTNGRVLQWDFNGTPFTVADGDLITITAVPEPTSIALAGLGLSGLVWRLRRRKAK